MKSSEIHLLKRRPSSVYTLILGAIIKRKHDRDRCKPEMPVAGIYRKGVTVCRNHLHRYNEICGIHDKDSISAMYPLTLVYPMALRLISRKPFPLKMFSMLNKRTRIQIVRKLRCDDVFDLMTDIDTTRVTEKGIEVDIVSSVMVGNDVIWKSINTFFFRGRFGTADPEIPGRLGRFDKPDMSETWYLRSENGFHYARLSGDSNGLHYSSRYAKMMGFKRDFIQPMFISETCLAHLGGKGDETLVDLDLHFKGQVYYGHNVKLNSVHKNGETRFDLYCEGNERPCICGLKRVAY